MFTRLIQAILLVAGVFVEAIQKEMVGNCAKQTLPFPGRV